MNISEKYCQSCLERYKITRPATRIWAENYPICDDCFQPLVNNIVGIPTDNDVSSKVLDNLTPLVSQVYDLLGVPEHLRQPSQDKFLKSYTDLFNHTSAAIVNLELKELTAKLEEYRLLFSVIKKGFAEAYVAKIDSLRRAERERLGVTGEEKSKKEHSKVKRPNVKLSQQESLARRLGISVADLEKAAQLARTGQVAKNETEFNKMIGKPDDGKCKKAYMKDGKPAICKLDRGHEGGHD